MVHMDSRRSHTQLANLERSWDAHTGESIELPDTPRHINRPVWTVDGWTGSQSGRATHRKPNISSSSSGDTDSYSDSYGSSTRTSISGASVGCCTCLCPASRRSSVVRHETEVVVMPASARLATPRPKKGLLRKLSLKEDNARFLLLAIVLLLYMLLGALVFQLLEEENEKQQRIKHMFQYNKMRQIVNDSINNKRLNLSQVDDLVFSWGNMSSQRYTPQDRQLWDFAGSFYFVYTIVSTIGYGAAAPRTIGGKVFCILYGLMGCSCGILFFNLFLERIITLLAYIMRARHDWKEQKKAEAAARKAGINLQRRDSEDSSDDDSDLDAWKPSVYWVMFYLTLSSVIIATLGATMYMQVEDWNYLDSIYFCFVSFATIGFGDFVSVMGLNENYGKGLNAYRFFNFVVLITGCCCIYSLFNVISIIVKQFLNFIIKRTAECVDGDQPTPIHTPRRNVISPAGVQKAQIKRLDKEMDAVYRSETERKLSGEMVSMREYISTNKVSLAVMQKELYETAMGRGQIYSLYPRPSQEQMFTPGQVGPLAIASSKLCDRRS